MHNVPKLSFLMHWKASSIVIYALILFFFFCNGIIYELYTTFRLANSTENILQNQLSLHYIYWIKLRTKKFLFSYTIKSTQRFHANFCLNPKSIFCKNFPVENFINISSMIFWYTNPYQFVQSLILIHIYLVLTNNIP